MNGARLHEICCDDPSFCNLAGSLYDQALFQFSDRASFRSDGRPARWALDLRRPLTSGDPLRQTSDAISKIARAEGVTQVAFLGVGGATLLGALLAANPTWRGGIVREKRKAYGFRELIEGSLTPSAAVAVVDDILSSGRTASKAVTQLRDHGLNPTIVIPIFHFAWRKGEDRMREDGIPVRPLARLNYLGRADDSAVNWARGRAWSIQLS